MQDQDTDYNPEGSTLAKSMAYPVETMKKKKIEDMPRICDYKPPRRLSGVSARVKQFQQISLSDRCKSIICGTLLGDGCLQLTRGYKNARLSIRHSQSQKEYFQWKVENLQEIAALKSVQVQKPDKNSYGKNKKLLFQSRTLEALTTLYNITYKHKRLYIRRRWLNQLTPLSLAVWWCDDGSIIGSPRRRGVLCTDGFTEKSVRKLARYLEKVWKVYARVGPIRRDRKYGNYSKQEYYRLWFSTEETKKFLRIIMPHIPVPSMVYKTILIYKDSLFQQRWISEVRGAFQTKSDPLRGPFFEAVDAYVKTVRPQKIPDREPTGKSLRE
jgi:hypothetical protein